MGAVPLECFYQPFANPLKLLTAHGILLLAGKSFKKQLPFVMIRHDASSEVCVDGQLKIWDVGFSPYLPWVKQGNFQRSSMPLVKLANSGGWT